MTLGHLSDKWWDIWDNTEPLLWEAVGQLKWHGATEESESEIGEMTEKHHRKQHGTPDLTEIHLKNPLWDTRKEAQLPQQVLVGHMEWQRPTTVNSSGTHETMLHDSSERHWYTEMKWSHHSEQQWNNWYDANQSQEKEVVYLKQHTPTQRIVAKNLDQHKVTPVSGRETHEMTLSHYSKWQ